MIYPLSVASGMFYRGFVKRILFKFKPDPVHEQLLRTSQVVQRIPFAMSILRVLWAYQNDAYLGQTICGNYYRNPVGLSAGFDKNAQLVPLIRAIGFGQTEIGSITYQPCPGNPRPWFYRLPKTKSIVVYAGLGNQGSEAIIPRLKRLPPALLKNFPLNISIAKTNTQDTAEESAGIADYVGSLRRVSESGIGDTVTLNISCPNAYGGEPFTTPASLEALLRAVEKLEFSKPVFLKMPIDLEWEAFHELLKVADQHVIVAGVTIGNLAKNRAQMKLKEPLPAHIKGNMSGKPTWELSNQLIQKTRRAYPDRFVIIGVGGISSAQDAYIKIRLGANMVELITGMIFEGPQVIGQINRGLVRLLQADGFTNVSQAVGIDRDHQL